ncbi:MAG: DUF1667 domain-containing protein, partial [Clostridia bacterium]|nr:DUF1667 domain-containing protein [Clostridia bacterium]
MGSIKNMTCIVCPMGCALEAELDDAGNIVRISGNTCKRGEAYARTELTDPRRTLTSTVKLEGSAHDRFLPVKTDGGIPKAKLFEAMKVLSEITAKTPVRRGD